MNRQRLAIHVMLGGMLLLPLSYLFESTSAAAGPLAFKTDLLLTRMPAMPLFDQIRRLEFPVMTAYSTKKGDDFWQFCRRFGLDLNSIRSSNDMDVMTLVEGTILKIPNHKGTLYTVSSPENLDDISKGYGRGRGKGNHFRDEILEASGYPLPDVKDSLHRFLPGTTLFLPEVLKPIGFPAPFQGRISSSFGRRRHPVLGIVRPHRGIDIPEPYGTKVYAARRGVVTQAGWMGGYGNMVEIRHAKHSGGFVYTRYGHLAEIRARVGQLVRPGTLIGLVGSTGISTGPHLHYEVRDESGRANNPMNY